MEEAILSVNASLKVTAPKGDSKKIRSAITSIVAMLQGTGELLKLDVSREEHRLLDQTLRDRSNALVAAMQSSNSSEKGKCLESLVVSLFESVAEFRVTQRVKTQTEEIDLWITNNADAGPFRREGNVILVECKNWSGKCGKNEFVSLLAKMMNRGEHCTLGFLISWNGFSKTIRKEMLRASLSRFRIVPLDGIWLRKVIATGSFREMLAEERERALMV
jgi:hypothetical protein